MHTPHFNVPSISEIKLYHILHVSTSPHVFASFLKDFSIIGNAIPMKKQTRLPDFRELCPPEQNYIADVVSLEIFFFFAGSVSGFLWEVFLLYLQEGTYVNRGFFYGPGLPVYGTGAVLFHILLAPQMLYTPSFSMRVRRKRGFLYHLQRFIVLFFLSAFLGSIIELAVGYFLDITWGLRYWDYSGYPFDFHGYICLWSALGFGIAGALWVGILSNFLRRFFFHLSAKILLLLFAFDCAAALIFPNKGYGVTFP